MNEFLNMAQQAGLYVIARPGPYINAETDGGGIPSWVLTSPNGYRSDAQPYLSAALQWLREIDPIIAAAPDHQGRRRDRSTRSRTSTPASHAADVQYMADLEQQATVRRHRRAVHVQPVLRRGHLHLRAPAR